MGLTRNSTRRSTRVIGWGRQRKVLWQAEPGWCGHSEASPTRWERGQAHAGRETKTTTTAQSGETGRGASCDARPVWGHPRKARAEGGTDGEKHKIQAYTDLFCLRRLGSCAPLLGMEGMSLARQRFVGDCRPSASPQCRDLLVRRRGWVGQTSNGIIWARGNKRWDDGGHIPGSSNREPGRAGHAL